MKNNENTKFNDHDERDPNPWLAMYLDLSIPINDTTKLCLMRDNDSKSTQYLLPVIKVFSKHLFLLCSSRAESQTEKLGYSSTSFQLNVCNSSSNIASEEVF